MEIILDKQVCFSLVLLLGKSRPQTLPWMGGQYQFSPLWPDLKEYSKGICTRHFSPCCCKTTKKKEFKEGLMSTLSLRDAIQMKGTHGDRNWRQLATGNTKMDAGTCFACLPRFYSETDPNCKTVTPTESGSLPLSVRLYWTHQESASELNPPNSIQIQSVDNDEPSLGSL